MPAERTQKKRMSASEKRATAGAAIQKLTSKKEQSEENKRRIANLQTILEKKDEELELMDLDEDDIVQTDTTKDNADQAATAKDNVEESNPQGKENDAGEPKKPIKMERRDSGSPLFVSQEESESEPEEEDPEYGRPLFYRPGPKPGQDVKTVGWTGGRRTMYINQYGPKNAAKHRLESFAASGEYEDEKPPSENVSNIHNRHGDEVLPNNKFRFTKRHIIAIYGVAWEGVGEADLDLIDPDVVDKDDEKRWPTTYVFIAWDVNGTAEKTWEPRQALRARWGKKQADKAIFEAACESEERYDEVQTGTRKATSRSPSVGLVVKTARQFRDQSLAAGGASPSRARRSSPSSKSSKPLKSKVSDATKAQWANTLEQFRTDYCECAGVESFQELSAVNKADFVKAWQHAKSEWVASA